MTLKNQRHEFVDAVQWDRTYRRVAMGAICLLIVVIAVLLAISSSIGNSTFLGGTLLLVIGRLVRFVQQLLADECRATAIVAKAKAALNREEFIQVLCDYETPREIPYLMTAVRNLVCKLIPPTDDFQRSHKGSQSETLCETAETRSSQRKPF